jgi:YVTN family beta-propeller protein
VWGDGTKGSHMRLAEIGRIDLPHGESAGYDHGDVHGPTGRVFLANTELGQVEVLDGPALTHVASITDCEGASGVLVAGEWMFGAARGSGEVLVIDASTTQVVRRFPVGPSPNGLAWDASREQLLVADVADSTARLFSLDGRPVADRRLAGRPRWAMYDPGRDAFLVNIRDPAAVEVLRASDLALSRSMPVDDYGPHGLGVDVASDTALVACDAAALLWMDMDSGTTLQRSELAGGPDVLWVDQTRRAAYVAIGDPGTLQVFGLDTRTELTRINTSEGAHTTAVDVDRGRLYIFEPALGQAVAYSLETP